MMAEISIDISDTFILCACIKKIKNQYKIKQVNTME